MDHDGKNLSISEQAETFNVFFSTIQSKSFVSDDDCGKYIFDQFKSLKKDNILKTPGFSLKKFTYTEVKESLDELSSTSSPGSVGIETKILKELPEFFIPFMLNFFNECLEKKTIPLDWKSAVITPLYKSKGDFSDFNNYRAISVLPPIAKIFEKLISKQMSTYFEDNRIIYTGQHGFRKGFSCESLLHEFVSDINQSIDDKLITLVLFIDYRKAFDFI